MSPTARSEGFTAAGREGLHAAAQRPVDDGLVPGLVALASRGAEAHVEALGTLAVGGEPVARDAIFRIASTTKPITAAATLALVAEGLLDLDAPVDRLLPELEGRRVLRQVDGAIDDTVPASRPITTRDLLTFTFGFGMSIDMFTAVEPWPVVEATQALNLAAIGPPDPSIPHDSDSWIAALASLPLLAQPGERWLYNTGAQVLGVLLARAAGQTFAEVLRMRIFEPLGMRDTGFYTPHHDRLATAYQPTPDGLAVHDGPDGVWSRPPAFCDGAAGLVSTADDLLAFARMLLRGGSPVLPRHAVSAMTTDQLSPSQKAYGALVPGFFVENSWGLGQAVYASGAYGWDGGLGTTWLVDPRRDLTMIVLTQRMFESPQPPQLHRDLQAAAYAGLA
ncbi:MAG: serine hydrolase domain-containing protein [Streptosporangiales bacterium]